MKLRGCAYLFLAPFNETKLILLYGQYGFNLIPELFIVDNKGNYFNHIMMFADINDVISHTMPSPVT